jgi:Fe2+ or Zn2+ uptake regulation protein
MIRQNLKITQYRDYLAKLLFVQTGPVIAEEILKYISVKIDPISTFSKKSPKLRISPKTTTKY